MYGIYPDSDEIRDILKDDLRSLPYLYPVPTTNNVILYIQRNWNKNTVCYKPNLNLDGNIDSSRPLNIYWQRFEESGDVIPLNYIQEKLIYGYKHKQINNDAWQINFVAKPEEIFYLVKKEDSYQIIRSSNGDKQVVTNIYAFTNNNGAFPNIKLLEFYGTTLDGMLPAYTKLIF